MRESPRERRLRSDCRALVRLRSESSIFDFLAGPTQGGRPPEEYLLRFRGRSFWRDATSGEVLLHDVHEVKVNLGAAYPRQMPDLAWRTPIFHPNISANGLVCLGGYSHHWAPSISLDSLCEMLWDMLRYQNYDIRSPFNRDAAGWLHFQQRHPLPLDSRPLRDQLAGPGASGTREVVEAQIVDVPIIEAISLGDVAGPATILELHPVAASLPRAARSVSDIVFFDT